jgi:hypothetical protein
LRRGGASNPKEIFPMKILTSRLAGNALNWAVAQALQLPVEVSNGRHVVFDSFEHSVPGMNSYNDYRWLVFDPCENWAYAGPILECELISPAYEPSRVYDDSARFKALCQMSGNDPQYGSTMLEAAMRCFVELKLGETVEIPEALMAKEASCS